MNILSFIPQAVRNQLVKPPRQYPYIDTFSDGIVAIIDISGYSNLSSRLQESLGADSGAKIKELLNPPIEVIVQTVHRSGGSIVKFAGDAVIAIWNHSCESDDVTREMASHAFVCCLDLLAYFKDFSITFEEPVRAECGLNYSLEIRPSTLTLPRGALRQSATTTPCLSSGITNNIVPMTNITGQSVTVVHSLKIHIGLGYGVVQQVHLGIYENGLLSRSEFFVSGKALDDAGALLGLGKQGDFVFRSKFWQLFAPNNSELKFITLNDSDGDPAFLLNELMDLAGLQSIQNLTGNFDQSILHSGSEDSPLLLETCHEIQLSAALPYIDDALAQAMSDAKVAIDSNLAPQCFIENLQMNTDIFLKRYDQTRNVTLVFILLSDFNVTTIAEGTNLKKLQECMAVIMKSVRKYQGCLRQINCDDKSLTALLVWGLPGFAHEKDEALFALPAALEIHSRLEATLGSKFSMGATSGIVFAGIVGNASRADGTVLGVAVNNAARIMCLKICNGLLLVDEAVFTAAHEAYDFDEGIPEVYLKGAGNRKLYRPVKRRQEKVTGSDVAPIGGRENELMVIRETIANWTQMKRQRLVITGRSGAGKSTLMNYSLRLLSQDPNVIVCQGAGQEHHQNTLLFCFSQIIRNVIERMQMLGVSFKGQSMSSVRTTTDPTNHEMLSSDSLNVVDKNIQAFIKSTFPSATWDVWRAIPGLMNQSKQKPIVTELIGKLTLLLTKITNALKGNELRICIVIDDIQWADSHSLELTHNLIHSCSNIFFLIISRPIEEFKESSMPIFQKLTESQDTVHINLKPLDESGIESLLMHAFMAGRTTDFKVESKLTNSVLEQSQGNSLVASSLITMLKEDSNVGIERGILRYKGEIRRRSAGHHSVVIAQFDKLHPELKSILWAASVAGQYFSLNEVLYVLNETNDQPNLTVDGILKLFDSYDKYQFVKETNASGVRMFSHFLIKQGILSTLVPAKRLALHSSYANYYERTLSPENYANHLQTLIFHLTKLDGQEERKQKFLYKAFIHAAESFQSSEAFEYYNLWNSFKNKVEFAENTIQKARESRLIAQLHYQSNSMSEAIKQAYASLKLLGYEQSKGKKQFLKRFVHIVWVLRRIMHMKPAACEAVARRFAYQYFPKAFFVPDSTSKSLSVVHPLKPGQDFDDALQEVLLQMEFLVRAGRQINLPAEIVFISCLIIAVISQLSVQDRQVRLSLGWARCAMSFDFLGFQSFSCALMQRAYDMLEGAGFNYEEAQLSSYATNLYYTIFDMRATVRWANGCLLDANTVGKVMMAVLNDASLDYTDRGYYMRFCCHFCTITAGDLKLYLAAYEDDQPYFERTDGTEYYTASLRSVRCMYETTQNNKIRVEELYADLIDDVRLFRGLPVESSLKTLAEEGLLLVACIHQIYSTTDTVWAQRAEDHVVRILRTLDLIAVAANKAGCCPPLMFLLPYLVDWILLCHETGSKRTYLNTSAIKGLVARIQLFAKKAHRNNPTFRYCVLLSQTILNLLDEANAFKFAKNINSVLKFLQRQKFFVHLYEKLLRARVCRATFLLQPAHREQTALKEEVRELQKWFSDMEFRWEVQKISILFGT